MGKKKKNKTKFPWEKKNLRGASLRREKPRQRVPDQPEGRKTRRQRREWDRVSGQFGEQPNTKCCNFITLSRVGCVWLPGFPNSLNQPLIIPESHTFLEAFPDIHSCSKAALCWWVRCPEEIWGLAGWVLAIYADHGSFGSYKWRELLGICLGWMIYHLNQDMILARTPTSDVLINIKRSSEFQPRKWTGATPGSQLLFFFFPPKTEGDL